jgi:ion channel-forming bestrophin family protein
VLLTVLGFVVGLALSFRSATAYERYGEGRKSLSRRIQVDDRYWGQMVLTTRNLARIIWVHSAEREGELGKEDLIGKLYNLKKFRELTNIGPLSICSWDL